MYYFLLCHRLDNMTFDTTTCLCLFIFLNTTTNGLVICGWSTLELFTRYKALVSEVWQILSSIRKDRGGNILKSLHKWQRLYQYSVNSSDMMSISPGTKLFFLHWIFSLYSNIPFLPLQDQCKRTLTRIVSSGLLSVFNTSVVILDINWRKK